ncbi:MAG: hypothetical protein LZT29_02776 [Pantoea stewartii]|uniref:hypothetical protein n=1 Tax=Pantoea stewartii TaxID=66269 RepID=UPI0024BE10A8|nr:hypothetical protein [Pantoea stewartii]WHS99747.1 MAG: hypothetical protein LZT29_02776 [Pantoea stewartii]
MNISDFIMGNSYFENLDFEEIERRFDLSVIEELSDNHFNRAIAKLLNMYLLGNSYISFRIVETFNDLEKLGVYETWIRLLRKRDEMEKLVLEFIKFKLSNES